MHLLIFFLLILIITKNGFSRVALDNKLIKLLDYISKVLKICNTKVHFKMWYICEKLLLFVLFLWTKEIETRTIHIYQLLLWCIEILYNQSQHGHIPRAEDWQVLRYSDVFWVRWYISMNYPGYPYIGTTIACLIYIYIFQQSLFISYCVNLHKQWN